MRFIIIPEDRVGALIGKDGETKKLIEDKCNVKLSVDSENHVNIEGDEEHEFFAESVVKAIGRGFSPKMALKLVDPDYMLHIFDLDDYATTKNGIIRLRSRIIGTGGKVKTAIEDATNSHIIVHGRTVSVIAKYDSIEYAKKAIDMILSGAKHSTLERYLSRVRRELFENRLSGGKHGNI